MRTGRFTHRMGAALCAVALTLLSIHADAQSGPGVPTTRTIRGTVVDATTNKPVAAAQIQPVGSTTVVFTEADGTFVIEGVAAGPVQLDIYALLHERSLVDVPAGKDTLDASLTPYSGEQIVIEQRVVVPVCILPDPRPREMHHWELLSGFRVGSGFDTREHSGGVFDLGLRAEVTYAANSWRSFRFGPFVALASTNVDSLEPMAGLTSYWREQPIMDYRGYEGSGAWVLSMSGGYAFQRDSMRPAAPVASVEIGYAVLLYRKLTTNGVCAPYFHAGDSRDSDYVCDVGPRFPTSMRLYTNARVYTVDDPAWAVTLGVELEPFGSWSALANWIGN